NAYIIYNHNIERNNNERKLKIKVFEDCHAAIERRLVRIAVKELKGDLKGIESLHVENVLRLVRKGRTGAVVELPGYIQAVRSYEHIVICKKSNDLNGHAFDAALNIPGITRPEGLDFTIVSEIKTFGSNEIDSIKNADLSSLVQFFDYEKLSCGINIRNRKDGDRFKPFGSNGTKKLKEYFIDNKIPRQLRDEIPLVALENEIVWIIGYKTSDKFRVTENTKRVLVLTYTKCI
ncbi:MAG TPA: tRNA lysidine(34) synthetase TilS, partial [Clostridia bacterium]